MKRIKRNPRWQNASTAKSYTGVHVVADFWFGKIVEDADELKKLLREAAQKANSTPLSFSHYKFSPQGITGVLLLAESHIAVHSWPEIQYMAIDIFTCGKNANPMEALWYLQKHLKPKKVHARQFKRGKRV